ncbi:MAG: hypothetical protein FWD73_09545 [Polyangiaceae bacterium]|nr:hypothetical protein [Polyangiaceae bacterium]
MPSNPDSRFGDIPLVVQDTLTYLIETAKSSFRDDLSSIVLFGSGAEGRLRTTSDLNLMIVLKQFQQERVDGFREPMRMAHVAMKAVAMFILETELTMAANLFPVKFGDIARRHRVLFGEMPAALCAISSEAQKRQLREMLMNLNLRLRQNYVLNSLREEQLAMVVANTAGSLRTAASTLLELEGREAGSPKASLKAVASSLDGGSWTETLASISEARETMNLPAGTAGSTLFQILRMIEVMQRRVEGLD